VTRRQDGREGAPPHGWEGAPVGGIGDGFESDGDAGALPGRVDDLRVRCQGPIGRHQWYEKVRPPPLVGTFAPWCGGIERLAACRGTQSPHPGQKLESFACLIMILAERGKYHRSKISIQIFYKEFHFQNSKMHLTLTSWSHFFGSAMKNSRTNDRLLSHPICISRARVCHKSHIRILVGPVKFRQGGGRGHATRGRRLGVGTTRLVSGSWEGRGSDPGWGGGGPAAGGDREVQGPRPLQPHA